MPQASYVGRFREELREELGLIHPVIGAKWAVKRYGAVVEESGVREGNPSVIRDGDIYRMYTARRTSSTDIYSIVTRTSSDGRTWSDPITVMTRDMINAAGYDVYWPVQPCVVKENNTYYLFFAARQMQPWGVYRTQIFLATSTDGQTFGNIQAVLTPRHNSMEGYIEHPFVVKFRERYYMACLTIDDRLPATNPMQRRLMLYVSDDLVNWSRLGIVNMEAAIGEWDAGRMLDHSIINVNDSLLLMTYAAEATANNVDMRIGLAYSFDIQHWFGRRMMLARVLDSEVRYVADSSILYEGGKLKIWYEADDGVTVPATGQSTLRILYAEAVMSDNHLMGLWVNKTVPDTGLATDDIDTKFERTSFHIISDQAGTLYIQAYDEAAGDFKDIDSKSVSANVLTVYNTGAAHTMARRMRLRFVPTAEATASAWAVMY